MRRCLPFTLALFLGLASVPASAQTPEAAEEEDWDDEEEWDEDEEPGLRPPDAAGLQLGPGTMAAASAEDDDDDEEEESDDDDEGDDLPSPAAAADRLAEGAGHGTDPTVSRWTRPQTVVELHGYMRFRGEFQDNFFFDRVNPDGTMDLPFRLFRPAEDGVTPPGGCGDGPGSECDQHANAFANMRLRLEPTIHLSDDVRVHMQFDVFDNMVLGSTPDSFAVGPGTVDGRFDPYYRYERTTFAPLELGSGTMAPPQYGRNSLTDSIIARRAWAEVRNRGLGELRFGRMGSHWGLGMLANGGAGIDSDYQTDVDRIMAITRLAGVYFFAAWDFASEGLLYQEIPDLGGLPFDRSRLDDVDQFVGGIAYRATEEEQRLALARGDAVFNIGGYFVYRSQNLSSVGTRRPFGQNAFGPYEDGIERPAADPVFVRRGAEAFIGDIWMQFVFEKLRLEMEAVFIYGTIENTLNRDYDPNTALDIVNFGLAFEAEYHLLNDQLGIYFYAGYASGDADVDGLTRLGGLQRQENGDTTYSTFSFHPNYRIDLIFWRTVMRQISGAYYFRPGLSYDFIKNPFGQLLGARADVIWSRASEPVQAWGNAPDLGVEIDVSAYYRSEDGPDILDGFYAMLQFGIFFPLDGLGYLPGTPNAPGLGNAMTFRLLLGVQY